MEVTCAPSNELVERLAEGELDLTLLSEGNEPPGSRVRWLWRGPLLLDRDGGAGAAPAAAADPVRQWLHLAQRGDRRRWTRRTCPGAWPIPRPRCPARWPSPWPGSAITVAMPAPLPDGLRQLGAAEGLPPLPDFAIGLLRGPGTPVAEALARHIEENFRLETSFEPRMRA